MNSIIPASEISFIQQLPTSEATLVAAQMTSVLSSITQEKNNINRIVEMLDKQSWWKRCILTVCGKNKATVAEIRRHQDQIAAYTSEAVAILYQSSRISQQQIVSLGEAINLVNYHLASATTQFLQTQELVYQLAENLDAKIKSIDNFHCLIKEIEQGMYSTENIIEGIISVIAQIDHRLAANDRQMNILKNALVKSRLIDDEKRSLCEYMYMLANISSSNAGIVYQELCVLECDDAAMLFAETIEKYSLLPIAERRNTNITSVLGDIFLENDIDGYFTCFSSNEMYDYFIDRKKELLKNISSQSTSNIRTNVNDTGSLYPTGYRCEQDIISSPANIININGGHLKSRVEAMITAIVDRYIHQIDRECAIAYDSKEITQIPTYIQNARAKFGFRATGKIIGLIDTSLRQRGYAGILFTTEGMAFDDAFEKKFLRYDEIKATAFSKNGKDLYLCDRSLNMLGEEEYNILGSITNTYYYLPYLKDMISEIWKITG